MKRFTDTEIWRHPWFRKLPPHLKELWRYLCDHCDPAGAIDPDWEQASFVIGQEVTEADIERFNGNVVRYHGKLWIPGFIEFQYGKLSRACIPHTKVFDALAKHGIAYPEDQTTLHCRVSGRVPTTLKEEEEDKEEDKDKKKTGGVGGNGDVALPPLQTKSIQQVQELKSLLAPMYKRRNTLLWNQTEEALIAEIVRRPDWKAELDELKTYREQEPKFFPGSIFGLLDGWDRTLDRARNHYEEPSMFDVKP